MKDYKKKYEDALNAARKFKNNCPSLWDTESNPFRGVFEELKQSEDERIKKKVIEVLKLNIDGAESQMQASRGVDRTFEVYACNKVISWLEKQEQKLIRPIWKYKKDHTPLLRDSFILNKYGCVGKSPSGALVSDVWVLDFDELAKLPKEEIEKQDEQKLTDKIEPKFKVGDWVTNGINFTFKVMSIKDDMYYRDDNYFIDIKTADKTFRLWTIQDTKAGDVLADDYGIYIFEKFDECDKNCFVCNGAYQYSEKVFECGHMLCSTDVHPATKEQRDLLFSKMKESGYEWDAEKKETRKIEQKPVDNLKWNELTWEDINTLEEIINNVHYEFRNGIGEESFGKEVLERFRETKGEEYVDAYEQKSTWSEEDEEIAKGLNNCIDELEETLGWCFAYVDDKDIRLSKIRNWLKSLKERMKGE